MAPPGTLLIIFYSAITKALDKYAGIKRTFFEQ